MSESSLPLVTRAAARQRDAVEQLLVHHLPGLQAWLRLRMGALLRARETPEDLMQSVAREVLDDLEGFEWRGEAAFRHWLYVKAQRKLIDRARFVAAERRRPDKEQPLDPVASGAAAALGVAASRRSRASNAPSPDCRRNSRRRSACIGCAAWTTRRSRRGCSAGRPRCATSSTAGWPSCCCGSASCAATSRSRTERTERRAGHASASPGPPGPHRRLPARARDSVSTVAS